MGYIGTESQTLQLDLATEHRPAPHNQTTHYLAYLSPRGIAITLSIYLVAEHTIGGTDMRSRDKEMSLPAAAHAIGCTWNEAYSLLLRGDLQGRLGTNGRWLVNRASVSKLQRQRSVSRRDKQASV